MQKFISFLFKLVILGFLGLTGLVLSADYLIDDLPDYQTLIDPRKNHSVHILSASGDDIGLRGTYFAGKITLDDISPHLQNAIIAIEDRKFYTHAGFDVIGIIRAMIKNISHGRITQGASTLTQQLAKDLFLTSQRSYMRKINELLYAVKLENSFTKKQIFELYINRVYMGAGLYGMRAASLKYFNKEPINLSISESALLAGLLKAPSSYCPIYNPIKAQKRAKIVLGAMYDAGFISITERDTALSRPVPLRLSLTKGGFGYVADAVVRMIPKLVDNPDQDLIVTTTIDTDLQIASDDTMNNFITGAEQKKISQGAFIAFDDTGRVLAMTGGKSYHSTPFNRTMQAYRQSGSAFKPFVYAAAFEAGYNPDDIFTDKDISFGTYRPTNYKNKYLGNMSLRSAFAQSVNTIAVQLADKTGIHTVQSVAERAGIVSPMKPYLSMTLGAFEVTPLELTAAYIPFFNQGNRVIPHIITKVQDKNGQILFEQSPAPQNIIFSQSVLNQMKDIFRATVLYGTAKNANLNNIPTYGKTGTTSGYKDAWFIGHAGEQNGITAGVWLGNDNFTAMNNITGGGMSTLLWHNILTSYFNKHPRSFEVPIFAPADTHIAPPAMMPVQGQSAPEIILNKQTMQPIDNPPIINKNISTKKPLLTDNPQQKHDYDDSRVERLLHNLQP